MMNLRVSLAELICPTEGQIRDDFAEYVKTFLIDNCGCVEVEYDIADFEMIVPLVKLSSDLKNIRLWTDSRGLIIDLDMTYGCLRIFTKFCLWNRSDVQELFHQLFVPVYFCGQEYKLVFDGEKRREDMAEIEAISSLYDSALQRKPDKFLESGAYTKDQFDADEYWNGLLVKSNVMYESTLATRIKMSINDLVRFLESIIE